MTQYRKAHCIFSVVHDGLVGGLLLLWPGLWHELLHADIERTTFYVPQALGVVALMRGCFGILALRSNDGRRWAALSGVWGAQVILCLMMVFRLGTHDPRVAVTYIAWAFGSAVVALTFWRSASSDH